MSIRIKINGKEVTAQEGSTIFQAAQSAGIEIPSLCHDIKLSPGRNCGLCVVCVNGQDQVKACETAVSEGMDIVTENDELTKTRRDALDTLLSSHRGDCIAPCRKKCPAHSDCQGYAGLIAEGFFDEAARLLKTSYPIPSSLGRVCPHPCEDVCRRGLLEGPVSLAALKQFAGDADLSKDSPYIPERKASSGKSVAVVGSGPAGLTAAWMLNISGHKVTVFEAMPEAGGMLRYGIPEFRLPKEVLGREIDTIERSGVEIKCNRRVNKESFEKIRRDFDAVFLAVGAWTSQPLHIPGEELPHVISGLELLEKASVGETIELGKHVAVVGGGNTAIDAVRTAARVPGVEKVSMIYRRSREQMPALDEEVKEAEREGAILHFLKSPVEIKADGNGLSVKLQIMELGEKDASGRRRPVPAEGKTEEFSCDTLIAAVGQKLSPGIPGDVLLGRNGAIETGAGMETSIPGVFAGGDDAGAGPGLAVEAVGDGQKAAAAIDCYLRGEAYVPEEPSYAEQDDLTAEDFSYAERKERTEGPLTEEQAKIEGSRCLECGCLDYYSCRLLSYAREYGMVFHNDMTLPHETVDRRQPYIFRDPNKCIACGLCVRVCKEIMGYGCWEMEETDGKRTVHIAKNGTLPEAYCISCGQCVEHCPTGALTPRNPRTKSVPLPPEKMYNTCNYCGVGCRVEVSHYGDKPLEVEPVYGGSLDANVLCCHGRYGWHTAMGDRDLKAPMVRKNQSFMNADWKEAYGAALDGVRRIQEKYGQDSVGVLIADRMTSEEIYQSQRLADALGTKSVYSANIYDGGVEDVFGLDGSTNLYQELSGTDCVLVVAADVPSYYAMLALPVQEAKFCHGAKLLVAAADGWNGFNFIADRRAVMEDDTRFLKEMIKDCIDAGYVPQNARGFDELKESLEDVVPGDEAKAFAEDYRNAANAMIMIDRERASRETAKLVCELAVVCGKIGRPHSGVIQMLQHNNTQTVSFMRIRSNMENLLSDIRSGKIKGMILAEQYIPDDEAVKLLEFTVLLDSAKGPAFDYADVFLPMPGYGSYNGTYVSAEGRVQKVNRIFSIPSGKDGWQVLDEMTEVFGGKALGSLQKIQASLSERFPDYGPCLQHGMDFICNGPIRYQNGFATEDGLACLSAAAEKAPAFGEMCFADVPLTVWFGQLIGDGVLNID